MKARLTRLRLIAEQRANDPQMNMTVGRARRWALCVKAALCVLFDWTRGGWPDHRHPCLDVCTWAFSEFSGPDGTLCDWTQLSVPGGILRGWHVHVYRDGT